MPGLDRTGPEGQGSRTGRQRGKCNPDNELNPDAETRMGRGMGRGAGRAAGRAAKEGSGRGLGNRHGGKHRSGRC